MDHEGAGPLHDIKRAPGEALGQLAVVFWEVGHCHAALPVEGLQVVEEEQRAHPSGLTFTKHTSHVTCNITCIITYTAASTQAMSLTI